MPPKRKAAAKQLKARRRRQEQAVMDQNTTSIQEALQWLNDGRFPNDIWHQIMKSSDIIAATVLGLTSKRFHAMHLKEIRKVGIENVTPVPAIPLNYELQLLDTHPLPLKALLTNWKGKNLRWNPFSERYYTIEQRDNDCQPGDVVTEAARDVQYEEDCLRRARHRERREENEEKQTARVERNEDRRDRIMDRMWYFETKMQYALEDNPGPDSADLVAEVYASDSDAPELSDEEGPFSDAPTDTDNEDGLTDPDSEEVSDDESLLGDSLTDGEGGLTDLGPEEER